jgi:hypothetical protein
MYQKYALSEGGLDQRNLTRYSANQECGSFLIWIPTLDVKKVNKYIIENCPRPMFFVVRVCEPIPEVKQICVFFALP